MKRRLSPSLPHDAGTRKAEAAELSGSGAVSVGLVTAAAARPQLTEGQQSFLRPDSLVFYLRSGETPPAITAFGFCIVCRKAAEPPAKTAESPHKTTQADKAEIAPKPVPLLRFMADNIVKSHQDKNFLEIALFHIAENCKIPRAKTLLLRAVADYCRQQRIDYIFGRFSFEGKYPAAYAREFSCLYHHYRVNKAFAVHQGEAGVSMDIMPAEAVPQAKMRHFLPPLLRYCLRLGAKAGDRVAVDKSYDKGAGAMNVFLLMPLTPQAEQP